MRKKKVIIYNDELNDDFAVSKNLKAKELTKGYKYVHKNIIWRFFEFIIYRIIAKPIILLITKIKFHHIFRNKKVIKLAKKTGGYIYSNHTNGMLDAFIPSLVYFKKKAYIIVSPQTTSIKGIKWLVQMLGAIPIGTNLEKTGEMIKCIEKREKQHALITVYPEAHIWPYFTGIRPFSEKSFRFPAKSGLPVYTITNCYKKKLFGKKPRVVSYVDGPFYRDENLSLKENVKFLRDNCYNAMKECANRYSTYDYIIYKKNENANENNTLCNQESFTEQGDC